MRRRSSALIWSSRRSTTDKTRSRRSSGVMLESARTTTSSSIFKRATSWCGNSLIITRVPAIRHATPEVRRWLRPERAPPTPSAHHQQPANLLTFYRSTQYSVLGTEHWLCHYARVGEVGWWRGCYLWARGRA